MFRILTVLTIVSSIDWCLSFIQIIRIIIVSKTIVVRWLVIICNIKKRLSRITGSQPGHMMAQSDLLSYKS